MLFVAFFAISAPAIAEETLTFQCSWDEKKPIEIKVNASSGIATRNDGGLSYNVIKITMYAVWLEVKEPSNPTGMKIQMIQRGKAVQRDGEPINERAGKWVDVAFSMTGTISPIDGGKCWEK